MWVGKATPDLGDLGNPDGVWGPEKLLIRCRKESHHPAEWAQGLRLSIWRTRKDTTLTGIRGGGQNITVTVRSPAPSHTQTLSNPFRTLAIKWEVNILLKKSSCIFIFVSLWCCRWQYNNYHHITDIYYFVTTYLFLLWYSWSIWRCFVLLLQEILFSFTRFSFLSHIYGFSTEISLVYYLLL